MIRENLSTQLTPSLNQENQKFSVQENAKEASKLEISNCHKHVQKCAAAKFKAGKEGQMNAIIMNSINSELEINKL